MAQTKPKNNTAVILGYGSQDRAIALNLRDSGYQVKIGLKVNSKTRSLAVKDNFKEIDTLENIVCDSPLIIFALPDHLQGRLYQREIVKNMLPRSTLVFLHGFAIHFGFIVPPDDCDVILIAPHAPGISVREKYLKEKNLSAFYAVNQDYSGKALKTTFELAKAVGLKKSKLVKTTFEMEALGDLFGEQAVLCGGMPQLILNGYKVLLENGFPPENAYLEVAYQLDLIIDLIKKYGIEGMYQRISVAARYGSVSSGDKIIDISVKKRMEKLYKTIKSGKFARELNNLDAKNLEELNDKISEIILPSFEKSANKFSK